MIQGTDEWFRARLGNVTPSRLIDIMPGPRGYRASRNNYIAEKVCERLTGEIPESFTSKAMEWGTNTEPLARAAYEAHTGVMVTEVGYLPHPTIDHFGGSPDALVGDDGLIEIKCPNTATHIDTLINGTVKPDYMWQMYGYMIITDRLWCDFVSYDPRMPDKHSLYISRFERNNENVELILAEVQKTLDEIDNMLEVLG